MDCSPFFYPKCEINISFIFKSEKKGEREGHGRETDKHTTNGKADRSKGN